MLGQSAWAVAIPEIHLGQLVHLAGTGQGGAGEDRKEDHLGGQLVQLAGTGQGGAGEDREENHLVE